MRWSLEITDLKTPENLFPDTKLYIRVTKLRQTSLRVAGVICDFEKTNFPWNSRVWNYS